MTHSIKEFIGGLFFVLGFFGLIAMTACVEPVNNAVVEMGE